MNQINRLSALLLFGLITLGAGAGHAQSKVGFEGSIVFRNGQVVEFLHLGKDSEISEYAIVGKLGAQEIRLSASEISEIVFTQKERKYNHGATNERQDTGDLVIINKAGERFTMLDAYFGWGYVEYTYLDPITKKIRNGRETIKDNILSIAIDHRAGNVKKNPDTEEIFPTFYNFDPFTGEKLVWAEEQ